MKWVRRGIIESYLKKLNEFILSDCFSTKLHKVNLYCFSKIYLEFFFYSAFLPNYTNLHKQRFYSSSKICFFYVFFFFSVFLPTETNLHEFNIYLLNEILILYFPGDAEHSIMWVVHENWLTFLHSLVRNGCCWNGCRSWSFPTIFHIFLYYLRMNVSSESRSWWVSRQNDISHVKVLETLVCQ